MGGMASHRCLLPKPQNLWICDLTWQDSHWRHHLVKDVQLGDYTGLSTWALCNRKGPEKREAGVRRERRRCDDGISSLGERGKSDHVMLLTLQTGEGTTNRGKQVASSTWKRQEQRFFPPGSPEGMQPLETLILAQQDPFWTPSSKTIIYFCHVKYEVSISLSQQQEETNTMGLVKINVGVQFSKFQIHIFRYQPNVIFHKVCLLLEAP